MWVCHWFLSHTCYSTLITFSLLPGNPTALTSTSLTHWVKSYVVFLCNFVCVFVYSCMPLEMKRLFKTYRYGCVYGYSVMTSGWIVSCTNHTGKVVRRCESAYGPPDRVCDKRQPRTPSDRQHTNEKPKRVNNNNETNCVRLCVILIIKKESRKLILIN